MWRRSLSLSFRLHHGLHLDERLARVEGVDNPDVPSAFDQNTPVQEGSFTFGDTSFS